MNNENIRSLLLEIISEKESHRKNNPLAPSLQAGSILEDAYNRMGRPRSFEYEEAILTCFYDLFRNGILSWGFNLSNPYQPHCHVTDNGKTTLEKLSRDPSNPEGYKTFLSQNASIGPVARSYIEEALNAYNSNCFKASAVMVGAAAESLVLTIQESLITKMDSLGLHKPRDLEDWRVKKILNAIETLIRQRKNDIDTSLFDSFEAYWPAFTHQIRTVRNDSGHPTSIEPVTTASVHASLLIFPELAILVDNLKQWINDIMSR